MTQILDQSCGCCEGVGLSTPQAVSNRPGLSAIHYRSGTWATFRATQIARLGSSELGALAALTTRDPDDYTNGLIDGWAMVGDILTFYQERLFSEALITTAREPWSLTELARLVGYEPAPGVAAAAPLAFTVESTPGAPEIVNLKAGLRVQSTPGQDETPVVYETTQAITARRAWNDIRPRQTRPTQLSASTRTLWMTGSTTGLKVGDGVYFIGTGGPFFAIIQSVDVHRVDKALDPQGQDMTQVALAPLGTTAVFDTGFAYGILVPSLSPPAGAFLGQTLTEKAFRARLIQGQIEESAVISPLQTLQPVPERVLVFKRRLGVFGANAPTFASLPASLTGQNPTYGLDNGGKVVITGWTNGPYFNQSSLWAEGNLTVLDPSSKNFVYLDGVATTEQAGGVVVLRDGTTWGVYGVDEVAETSHSRFTVTGKTTRLTLEVGNSFTSFGIRSTTVYVENGWMALAPEPITTPVADASITPMELEGWRPGLTVGQRLSISGRALGGPGEPVSEIVEIQSVVHDFSVGGRTRITVSPSLSHSYERGSVHINANVALATHGSSLSEVLGSGDAQMVFPVFATRDGPVTFVPASTPSGGASTLEIRVNDLLWHETPNLLQAGPTDRVFITRGDEKGRTLVQFGDGRTGARLPSGVENIRAQYRKGSGLSGRVRKGQLDMLLDRPLGLKSVANPLTAEGGADPESPDGLRQNAPLTVRTLGRAVGLTDYEDYASAFGGIAKARAARTTDRRGPFVLVTVAAQGATPVPDTGDLAKWLRQSLAEAGDPYARFQIVSFRPATFHVAAKVTIAPDYVPALVLASVEARLRADFAFAARSFAQPVWLSEVMAAAHAVPGVVAIDVDRLYRDIEPDGALGAPLPLPAKGLVSEPHHRAANGLLLGAELLMLHPGPLDYLEVAS
jgi:hypothetical protein